MRKWREYKVLILGGAAVPHTAYRSEPPVAKPLCEGAGQRWATAQGIKRIAFARPETLIPRAGPEGAEVPPDTRDAFGTPERAGTSDTVGLHALHAQRATSADCQS
jgi:hypothetical protein